MDYDSATYIPGPGYPLPTAQPEFVEKLLALYRDPYREQCGRDLTYDEAKRFLEGLMQFIYLTEVLTELEENGVAPAQIKVEMRESNDIPPGTVV